MNSSLRIGLELLLTLREMTILRDDDLLRRNRSDLAALGRQNNRVRISRDLIFQPSAHERRLGNNERNALALHVGAHQRPVCVVVFQERNKARRHRHELFRRDVHVIHLGRINFQKVAAVAHRDFLACEMSATVYRRIGLCHEKILLAIGGKIFDLIGHAALFHFAIGCLDETKLIDARESAHRTNQADVWTFRRLNGTNASVMRRVNVAHLEPGPFSAETTRTKSRQTTLVRQLCKWIRLIHELRKL